MHDSEWRRPVIYNPGKDKVYLGAPGSVHSDIGGDNNGYAGYVSLGDSPTGHGYNRTEIPPKGLGWLGGGGNHLDFHDRVQKALIPHEPAAAESHHENEDMWNFDKFILGKVAALPTEPPPDEDEDLSGYQTHDGQHWIAPDTGWDHVSLLQANEHKPSDVKDFYAWYAGEGWESLNQHTDDYADHFERKRPPHEQNWDFESKVVCGKVQIVEGTRTTENSHFKHYDESRPVIFDIGGNRIVIGQPGTHHADIIDEFKLHGNKEFEKYDCGTSLEYSGNEYLYGSIKNNQFSYYDKEDFPEEALQALKEYGVSTPNASKNVWDFESFS